jgi:hypothetical protein
MSFQFSKIKGEFVNVKFSYPYKPHKRASPMRSRYKRTKELQFKFKFGSHRPQFSLFLFLLSEMAKLQGAPLAKPTTVKTRKSSGIGISLSQERDRDCCR